MLLGGTALLFAPAALADGFSVGGNGGPAVFDADEVPYAYTTRDLVGALARPRKASPPLTTPPDTCVAVDLASPLVAYRVVTTALNQEVPRWLDAIIVASVLGAVFVLVTDNTSLDGVLH